MTDLTVKQIKAIALLCQGKNQTSAAAELKLNIETLRRWSFEPTYRIALAQARSEVWIDAVGEASTRVLSALATLQLIFQDPEMPPSARVSAAKAFIELTKPPVELTPDGIPEGDRAEVVIYLPDNGRRDYGGSIAQQRGEED